MIGWMVCTCFGLREKLAFCYEPDAHAPDQTAGTVPNVSSIFPRVPSDAADMQHRLAPHMP